MTSQTDPFRETPDDWLARFERSGLVGRLAMLSGGAVRVAATLVDRALDRAATIAVDTHEAFRKELDPNVSDARVLEETTRRADDAAAS